MAISNKAENWKVKKGLLSCIILRIIRADYRTLVKGIIQLYFVVKISLCSIQK